MSVRQNTKNVQSLEEEIAELEKQWGESQEENPEKPKAEPQATQPEPEEKEPEPEPAPEEEPVSAEEKTFKKRYSDLRRHFQKTKEQLESQIEELRNAKPAESPPVDEKTLQEWMKKNKKSADLLRAMILKEVKGQKPDNDVESRLKELEDMKMDVARQKAEAVILNRHPDFEELRDQDEFHQWAEKQPPVVQNALYDNETDGELASWAIQLYKNEVNGSKTTEKPKDDRKRNSARTVSTKSSTSAPQEDKKVWKESQIKKMSDTDFEKNFDSIQKSMSEGTFVYDLSKKG